MVDQLPERAVVVGAGYIALEFAGILNGLGVDTHIMFRGDKPLRGCVYTSELQFLGRISGLNGLCAGQQMWHLKCSAPGRTHARNCEPCRCLGLLRLTCCALRWVRIRALGVQRRVRPAGQHQSTRRSLLWRRFDEECREQVATNMTGRGLHIYPQTSPTRFCSISFACHIAWSFLCREITIWITCLRARG